MEKLVRDFMSEIYSKFDRSCRINDVFKLYTIGDCYVLMGLNSDNVNEKRKEEAKRVIETGIKMLNIFKYVKEQYLKKIPSYGGHSSDFDSFKKLDIRIGIHTVEQNLNKNKLRLTNNIIHLNKTEK